MGDAVTGDRLETAVYPPKNEGEFLLEKPFAKAVEPKNRS
jgi:hypothetical protein